MNADNAPQPPLRFDSFFHQRCASPSPRTVIIDTDMGWDDVLSILYLLKKPDINIAGITVTGCGEANLPWGTTIALTLLEVAGRTDVPVCGGTETPLKYDHCFPQPFREDMNGLMGLLDSLPKPSREPDPRTAWEFLSDTLNQASEPLTILSLGGFTNFGRMFLDCPDTKLKMIDRIYAMAGAVFVDGNVDLLNNACAQWDQGPLYSSNNRAEWNMFVDPLAAKMVFDSEIPLTIIPLDACNYVLLLPDTVAALHPNDPVGNLAKRILDQKTGPYDETIPVPIFDPLATMVMCGDLNRYQYLTGYFDVDVSNAPANNTSGAIVPVIDGSRIIQVVQGVSCKEFTDTFAAVMNS